MPAAATTRPSSSARRPANLSCSDQAGPIVGILPDAQFSDTVVTLEPGDILTLFTDGVTEQENENDEQFSLDRLKHLIVSKESYSAAQLVADVTEAVSTFAGTKEQEDDLTIVVAKILCSATPQVCNVIGSIMFSFQNADAQRPRGPPPNRNRFWPIECMRTYDWPESCRHRIFHFEYHNFTNDVVSEQWEGGDRHSHTPPLMKIR